MLDRIEFKMPSTTNSLEATHGQLNRNIPRRNNFFHAIYKISKCLIKKAESTNENIKQNYNSEKRKTVSRMISTNQTRLENEVRFYKTTKDSCTCNENKLNSALLGIDMPCRHRYHLGVQFPNCPESKVPLEISHNKLSIEYVTLEDDNSEIITSYEDFDKKYACETICRFSKFKDKLEIMKYVNSVYCLMDHKEIVPGQEYINGIPLELVKVIDDGIIIFSEKHQKAKTEKN